LLLLKTACRRWTQTRDVRVSGSTLQSQYSTLFDCRDACEDNSACNGVDFNENVGTATGQRCYLSLAGSTTTIQPQSGFSHNVLDRNCHCTCKLSHYCIVRFVTGIAFTVGIEQIRLQGRMLWRETRESRDDSSSV